VLPDLVEAFRSTGSSWQTGINDALRDWLGRQPGRRAPRVDTEGAAGHSDAPVERLRNQMLRFRSWNAFHARKRIIWLQGSLDPSRQHAPSPPKARARVHQ